MPIDPTLPADAVAAEKSDLRDNLQAAKDGIEAAVTTNANTAITVNAASFGDHQFIKILCTGATAITVTLANNVPAGKAVELVAYHATADVTAQAGSGATLVKPASAVHATTEQYEAVVYEVDTNSGTNAAWRLVARP